MSRLLDMRDAIVSTLKADARLSGVNVYDHGGEFTEDDLTRYSKQAPALIVALLGGMPEFIGGAIETEAAWCIIAITRDAPAMKRDRSAIALVDATLRSIMPPFYENTAAAGRLRDFRARNLFGPKIDALGVSLWSIVATQRIELADDTDITVDFNTLHVDYTDLHPADPLPADQLLATDDIDLT